MCARYALAVEELDGLPLPPGHQALFNVAPTHYVPILQRSGGQWAADRMSWGHQPHWAKNRLINLRSEGILENAWKRAQYTHRRVIVPASGFFEWTTIAGERHPRYFHRIDNTPLLMAAIWSEDGESLEPQFIVLTTGANAIVREIHDRMPILFDEATAAEWLAATPREAELLHQLALPEDLLHHYGVTRKMNYPGYQNPDSVVPIAG